MPGITGMGLTYNLPNYVGELFAVSKEDTPLLSAIGGLTGGRSTGRSTTFEWQGYDLRDAASDRQRLEGAAAPDGEERVRFNASNVVEIHQEAVELSYTRQGAQGMADVSDQDTVNIGGTVVPANEMDWQLEQQFKQIARDVELSFIQGTYQNVRSARAEMIRRFRRKGGRSLFLDFCEGLGKGRDGKCIRQLSAYARWRCWKRRAASGKRSAG